VALNFETSDELANEELKTKNEEQRS
jgi:hypothetical protein